MRETDARSLHRAAEQQGTASVGCVDSRGGTRLGLVICTSDHWVPPSQPPQSSAETSAVET